MAAITDLSDLVNRCTGGNNGTPEVIFFHKIGRIAGSSVGMANTRPNSLWLYDGSPSAGVAPTSGAIPTNATNGALKQANPGGSREKWLLQFAVMTELTNGAYILYDRLYHIGGLSGTSTSDQTVQGSPASPALTRNTGGVGNMIGIEIYTQIGSTERTLTVTYTNQAGTGGKTATCPLGGTNSREPGRIVLVPLAAGDTGVQAVEKVALSASTGTAGDFGVTILRPLAFVSAGHPGSMGSKDFSSGLPGIPKIDTNACLAAIFTPNGATAPSLIGCISMVEK